MAAFALLTLGCGPRGPGTDDQSGPPPLSGVNVSLAVVDDPALASALERLRGEWSMRTGGDFQVRRLSQKDFEGPGPMSADAAICGSHLLGPAAEQSRCAPLKAEDAADVFELVRVRTIAWGGQVCAVPFGSPLLVCYCRADLLEKLGRRPPTTWRQYQELAQLMAERKELEAAVAEPLGPGWAGLVLLARAASYAKHRENYSALFQIDTMEPLVSGPPFQRALEELVAAARLGLKEQIQWGADDVRRAFWQGRCGLALCWPTAAAGVNAAPGVQVAFAELPGSKQVFNVGRQSWDTRPDDEALHVPLLGVAGRIGLVSAASARAPAATQLLVWLSTLQPDAPPSAASPWTTLYRQRQLASPRAWVEKPAQAAASQYAAVVHQTLSRSDSLFALRIPGHEEYLAALDKAVQQAVGEKRPVAEVLAAAAAEWKEITQRLGRNNQRTAYLRSLGLEP